nr:MAG TPA: hypothetical protein [Caudoviricetes sp.]
MLWVLAGPSPATSVIHLIKNRLTHDRPQKGQKVTYKPCTNRKEG